MNLAEKSVVKTLGPRIQAGLVEQVRDVLRQAPLVQPKTPNGLPMRVRVSAAGGYGWVGDGAYRYDRAQGDGRRWPPIPNPWMEIADSCAGPQRWDCAIINWYAPGASLGWHQDLSERDHSLPIVTISLGDDCSWAIRINEGSPPHRCILPSGSCTLLSDDTRLAFHSVERIVPAPLLSPLKVRGRISITMRVAG